MQKYLQQYLTCQKHNQPLNLVCLDQNCQKKGIICPYCQYKQHKHQVRSLGLLLAQVDKDTQTYSQSLTLLSQLDNMFIKIQQQLTHITNESQHKIIKQMSNTYFTYHVNILFKRNKLVNSLLQNQPITKQLLNQFILNYNFVDKNNNPNNYTNSQYQIRIKLEEFQNAYKELKESIKNGDGFDKIMKIFQVDQNKRIKYYFNNQKCHKDFIITDKIKVQLKEGYSYRIGCLDPPIKKQNGKLRRKTCSFKINKVTALVGVGVVYKKKVETVNYLFSAYSQHGCYFVTNSGYTYNQSNPTFNSQIKGFNYTNNDVIKVTIDPKEKKVIFQKQGKDPFQMPFDEKPDMEINFAVLLCQQNQSVEVMLN